MAPGVTNPESLTMLDDGLKFTISDGGSGTLTNWVPIVEGISFTLELIGS